MKKILIIIIIAVAIVGLGITLYFTDNKSITSEPTSASPNAQIAANNDLSGIPNSAQLLKNLQAAELDALSSEGTVQHTHQHLDIIINGQAITVPAEIGVGSNFISPIHTHDTTGIIHVESPVQKDFYLSQLFTEWGIKLTNSSIGNYATDATDKLVIAVNGKVVSDVSKITLNSHDEIEIWYGDKNINPTLIKTYSFPSGL